MFLVFFEVIFYVFGVFKVVFCVFEIFFVFLTFLKLFLVFFRLFLCVYNNNIIYEKFVFQKMANPNRAKSRTWNMRKSRGS